MQRKREGKNTCQKKKRGRRGSPRQGEQVVMINNIVSKKEEGGIEL